MKSIIIPVFVLGLAAGGYYVISNSNQSVVEEQAVVIEQPTDTNPVSEPEEQVVETNDARIVNEDVMVKEEEGDMEKKEESEVMIKEEEVMVKEELVAVVETQAVSLAQGTYQDYSPERVSQANGKVVLFFMAAWCPSCRALDGNISANTDDIPQGVTILKVDYDSNAALRKEYAVTTQHTLVQVDESGNAIQSWRGGNSLSSVISKL